MLFGLVLLGLVLAGAATGCAASLNLGGDGAGDNSGGSGNSGDNAGDNSTDNSTVASVPLGNPGTLVPPTTVPDDTGQTVVDLPIGHIVAFLNACAADSGLVGPCHCAASRLSDSFTIEDIDIFEDRITGRLEYPPQVAAALASCQNAPAPTEWGDATRQYYMRACTKGSALLEDPCTCSVARAQDVIPADRLDEFIATPEVRPDFTDLINLCL